MKIKRFFLPALLLLSSVSIFAEQESAGEQMERYIQMPPVIRLAAPIVSVEKNGREEWVGITLMGPLRNTDFYGIHFAYLIENNSGTILNGISIATYGNAQLCNGFQVGLLLNESNANGWQFATIGNQAAYCNGWQFGIINRAKTLAGLQTGIFNYLTEKSEYGYQFGITNMSKKAGTFQIGFVNKSDENAVQIGFINLSPKGFIPFINWN